MTKAELRDKIKSLIPAVYDAQLKVEDIAVEYDELTKFPELKKVIVNLLTTEFDNFLSSLDWIAPRPTTFRVNLKNGQFFLLIYGKRSWIAQVEGKKYYLLNLPEEERAAEAIARILRYGKMKKDGEEDESVEDESVEDLPSEEVEVDDTTDVEV